ncbi:hypothetical protein BGX27_010307 [Mortierella sp. AM989]|nr:hypothetical protein BGX27_010307 [Mortierella sp. AM989]
MIVDVNDGKTGYDNEEYDAWITMVPICGVYYLGYGVIEDTDAVIQVGMLFMLSYRTLSRSIMTYCEFHLVAVFLVKKSMTGSKFIVAIGDNLDLASAPSIVNPADSTHEKEGGIRSDDIPDVFEVTSDLELPDGAVVREIAQLPATMRPADVVFSAYRPEAIEYNRGLEIMYAFASHVQAVPSSSYEVNFTVHYVVSMLSTLQGLDHNFTYDTLSAHVKTRRPDVALKIDGKEIFFCLVVRFYFMELAEPGIYIMQQYGTLRLQAQASQLGQMVLDLPLLLEIKARLDEIKEKMGQPPASTFLLWIRSNMDSPTLKQFL